MSEEARTLQDKFMLRLPDGMRDRIKAEADKHGRSMNAEIVSALEEKYPAPPEDFDLLDYCLQWVVPIKNAKTPEDARARLDEANRAAASFYPGTSYKVELVVHELEPGVGISLIRASDRSSFRVMLTELTVIPAGYVPTTL